MITKEYLAVLPKNWGCVKFKTWYKAETNIGMVALEAFEFKWKKITKTKMNLNRVGFKDIGAFKLFVLREMVIIPLKQVNQAKTYLIDLDKGICNVLGTKKKTKHLKKNTPTV